MDLWTGTNNVFACATGQTNEQAELVKTSDVDIFMFNQLPVSPAANWLR